MEHVVYLTIYRGKKLPKRYIGSTTIQKIKNGYVGSVRSKKWTKIFEEELENNPHLFKTRILSYHNTKEERAKEELRLQKKYDVVKSSHYFNESYAQPNGFCGRDVGGENNPNFGGSEKWRQRMYSDEHFEWRSQRSRKGALTQWADKESAQKKIDGMTGKKKTLKTITKEEFTSLQQEKSQKSKEKNCLKFHYNNKRLVGWIELSKEVGKSPYLCKKLVEQGVIEVID